MFLNSLCDVQPGLVDELESEGERKLIVQNLSEQKEDEKLKKSFPLSPTLLFTANFCLQPHL